MFTSAHHWLYGWHKPQEKPYQLTMYSSSQPISSFLFLSLASCSTEKCVKWNILLINIQVYTVHSTIPVNHINFNAMILRVLKALFWLCYFFIFWIWSILHCSSYNSSTIPMWCTRIPWGKHPVYIQQALSYEKPIDKLLQK